VQSKGQSSRGKCPCFRDTRISLKRGRRKIPCQKSARSVHGSVLVRWRLATNTQRRGRYCADKDLKRNVRNWQRLRPVQYSVYRCAEMFVWQVPHIALSVDVNCFRAYISSGLESLLLCGCDCNATMFYLAIGAIYTVEKWLFWISQGKVATSDRWGGQICKMFTSNFPRI